MSLIIARIETEDVGWGRGDVMLTLIKSFALWPSVTKMLRSALTASHWARRLTECCISSHNALQTTVQCLVFTVLIFCCRELHSSPAPCLQPYTHTDQSITCVLFNNDPVFTCTEHVILYAWYRQLHQIYSNASNSNMANVKALKFWW